MTAKLIKTYGSIVSVKPANGTDFQLEELSRFVQGYIEVIHPPEMPGYIMVINEEGKLKCLPWNPFATRIWRHDDIVGNALLCRSEQVR